MLLFGFVDVCCDDEDSGWPECTKGFTEKVTSIFAVKEVKAVCIDNQVEGFIFERPGLG